MLHRADRLVPLGDRRVTLGEFRLQPLELRLQPLVLLAVGLAPRLRLDDDRPERRKLRAQAVAQRTSDLVEVVGTRLVALGVEDGTTGAGSTARGSNGAVAAIAS